MQMMSMLPGFNSEMIPGMQGGDKASQLIMKRYITIIESMTEAELDTQNIKMLSEPSRINRLARGSGRPPQDVYNLMEAYKHYSKYASQVRPHAAVTAGYSLHRHDYCVRFDSEALVCSSMLVPCGTEMLAACAPLHQHMALGLALAAWLHLAAAASPTLTPCARFAAPSRRSRLRTCPRT